MKLLSMAVDQRSARLVKVCQSLALMEDVEASVKRNLVNQARGVRLLIECAENSAALDCISALEKYVSDMELDSIVAWPALIVRHCGAVRVAVEKNL